MTQSPAPTSPADSRSRRSWWCAAPWLLALSSALLLMALTRSWPQTPDGVFHLQRVRALSDALAAGVIYPRLFPDFAFGYGYPVLNYYAPAFYYPPALLHLAGVSVLDGARLTLALVYGLAGAGMFLWLRRWTGLGPALAGACLYQLFPYRFYDLVVRGALPEFAAFLWLPWIGYFSHRLFFEIPIDSTGSRSRLPAPAQLRDLAGASLMWCGLILTHNLTAMIAALTLAILWPLAAARVDGDGAVSWAQRLWTAGLRLGLPVLLAALLSAWYVMPALLESGWVGIGATGTNTGYTKHFSSLAALIQPAWPFRYPAAAEPTVPFPLWLALLLPAGAFFLFRSRTPRQRGLLLTGLLLTVVTGWLTTRSSAGLWEWSAPLLGTLQFPWRWQTITAIGVAILLAGVLDGLRSRARLVVGAGTFFVLLAAGHSLAALPAATEPITADALTVERMWAFDAEMGQVGATWTGEFLPRWVQEERWAIGREPTVPANEPSDAGTDLAMLPVHMGYLTAIYRSNSSTPASIHLQRFYFPTWHIRVDQAPVPTTAAGRLGLLSTDLPADAQTVTVRWSTSRANWLGRTLAAGGWLLLLALIWRGWPARRRLWPALAWLLVGLLLLVAASGRTEHLVTPTPVEADFGPVRLEASHAPPAAPGNLATVQLFWTIQAADPGLTAFIHVVDESGTVVAQHDGPLTGRHVPAARWEPGMIFSRQHPIPLPPELPAGHYGLMAGVYRPGAAGAPLTAAGQSEPRVMIGRLEVKP